MVTTDCGQIRIILNAILFGEDTRLQSELMLDKEYKNTLLQFCRGYYFYLLPKGKRIYLRIV
jgi:hypothetical protein